MTRRTDTPRPERPPRRRRVAEAGPRPTGELMVTLGGEQLVLRPDFRAIVEIEAATGQNVWTLAKLAEAVQLHLMEAGVILAACLAGAARQGIRPDLATATPQRMAELVMGEEGGLVTCCATVLFPLLTAAALGGYTPQGERKPATS